MKFSLDRLSVCAWMAFASAVLFAGSSVNKESTTPAACNNIAAKAETANVVVLKKKRFNVVLFKVDPLDTVDDDDDEFVFVEKTTTMASTCPTPPNESFTKHDLTLFLAIGLAVAFFCKVNESIRSCCYRILGLSHERNGLILYFDKDQVLPPLADVRDKKVWFMAIAMMFLPIPRALAVLGLVLWGCFVKIYNQTLITLWERPSRSEVLEASMNVKIFCFFLTFPIALVWYCWCVIECSIVSICELIQLQNDVAVLEAAMPGILFAIYEQQLQQKQQQQQQQQHAQSGGALQPEQEQAINDNRRSYEYDDDDEIIIPSQFLTTSTRYGF